MRLNAPYKIISLLVLAVVLVGVPAFFYKNVQQNLEQKVAPDMVLAAGNGGNGSSGGPGDLCGFAWGGTDNSISPAPAGLGVGWVSFNSKDCDTDGDGTISDKEATNNPGCPAGGTGTYGVSVDDNNNLTGYAWSSNVGWLQFGRLDSFPSAGEQQNATIQGSGALHGWARFCAGTANGDCSTMDSRTDGWDGWLNLRDTGKQAAYGVTLADDQTFSGYSWGSDVVGWLNWNPGSGKGVRYCDNTQTLAVILAANPSNGATKLVTTLTATPQYSGGGTLKYSFMCGNGDGWSSFKTTTTYPCSYGNAGNYTPQVRATDGTLNAQSSAQVTAYNGNSGFGVVCSASPNTALINQKVNWHATISGSGQLGTNGEPSYTYTFTFQDGSQTAYSNDAAPEKVVTKQYSTVGIKTVSVTVKDNNNSDNGTNTQTCNANANIIIQPKIIEI